MQLNLIQNISISSELQTYITRSFSARHTSTTFQNNTEIYLISYHKTAERPTKYTLRRDKINDNRKKKAERVQRVKIMIRIIYLHLIFLLRLFSSHLLSYSCLKLLRFVSSYNAATERFVFSVFFISYPLTIELIRFYRF